MTKNNQRKEKKKNNQKEEWKYSAMQKIKMK